MNSIYVSLILFKDEKIQRLIQGISTAFKNILKMKFAVVMAYTCNPSTREAEEGGLP